MEGWSTRHEVRSRNWEQLREEKLQELLSLFDKRMGRLNDQYLRMMGEHIADIGTMWPSDVHRLQQIRRMNKNLRQIQHRIGVAAERSAEDIERVFEQIANYDIRMAEKILGKPDTHTVGSNAFLRRILQAQQRETIGRMRNLSNTTVVSKYYRDAIDEAVSAVQSGVEDYGAATRRVIREAGANGLRMDESGSRQVDYLSGYHRRLDTAARMNVLDGVQHLNQTIMEEVGREFGANGVEIDAHMLCAEDHLPYQGGQYSNEDFEQIQDGLQRPFGEWNCRHSWHPIMLGISPPTYSPEELHRFEQYSTEPVTIDDRTMTRYQWSQEMRRIETAIRSQKDTATLARYSGDDRLRQRCQGSIVQLNQRYAQVANGADLTPEYRRMYVAGFRDVKNTGDVGAPNNTTIDWASANNLASGDVRLTNMLRSGDAQQTGTAINEILNDKEYGFKESKWSGNILVKDKKAMGNILGQKEWSCDISIRKDNIGNIKTFIHENLHSRSGSYFPPETYSHHKALEEGAVEYMAQQICEKVNLPYSQSYVERVDALKDLRSIICPEVSEYDFAKTIFDKDEDMRYTYIANRVNAYKIDNPNMRKAVRDSLNDDLRILAGIPKGGRSYE